MIVLAGCAGRFSDPDSAGGAGVGSGGAADVNAPPDSPQYFTQAVGDRVFFAVDQSSLSAAARATLQEQARWLQRNPAYDALVEGHADEQGTREYNLALGARRASSVEEFLVQQGVAPGRVDTVSYGKERPVEVCSTEDCYSRNRRAVTVLQPAGGA
jgi:peptidoglycan-associated lipoprotein